MTYRLRQASGAQAKRHMQFTRAPRSPNQARGGIRAELTLAAVRCVRAVPLDDASARVGAAAAHGRLGGGPAGGPNGRRVARYHADAFTSAERKASETRKGADTERPCARRRYTIASAKKSCLYASLSCMSPRMLIHLRSDKEKARYASAPSRNFLKRERT
jgi:hypothetical protein